jgi:hypothetical protein
VWSAGRHRNRSAGMAALVPVIEWEIAGAMAAVIGARLGA